MVIDEKTKKAMAVINRSVRDYETNKHRVGHDRIQTIRDTIAVNVHYLSEFYSELRIQAEAGYYLRKSTEAELRLKYRKEKREKKLPLTEAAIKDKALVESKSAYITEQNTNKNYYFINKYIDSANRILNSISSRLKKD